MPTSSKLTGNHFFVIISHHFSIAKHNVKSCKAPFIEVMYQLSDPHTFFVSIIGNYHLLSSTDSTKSLNNLVTT